MAVRIFLKNSVVEDKRPDPGDLSIGELTLNANSQGAFLCCEDSAGNIQQVGGLKISETEPGTPVRQTVWFQPSTEKLFIYDGSEWLTASAAGNIDFTALASYTSPDNDDQIAILDTTSNTVKKVSLEDLLAKRARDSRRIYLSKDIKANDSNNGTSPEEPLLTFAAAIAAAEPGDVIEVSPGTYTEASLPLRVPRDVGIFAKSLRQVKIQPAAGQEMNGFFKVDSGFWVWGLEFAGHQADLANNQQSWAISFDDQADNTAAPLNASGLGAFILKSPYVQNCSSVTAEDDAGTAGSVSVGDTGGGIEVDGDKCAANSPIRSMVVDSYTQVNLGGPGCLVLNDGYAQLVSFFGTFCTFHVKSETGGQANLSGGGTTDFGDQGLVADGYSRLPNFTGSARVAAYGADRSEAPVVINPSLDTFTTVSAHSLVASDQVTFSATDGTLPTGVTAGTTYYVIASGLTATAFKVSATEGGSSIDVTGSATGTYQFVRQGQLTADVISFTANRIGSKSRPNPGQLMFPRQTFPSAGQPGSAGNAVGVTAGAGSTFTVILNTFSYSHEYVSGGTVTVGGTSYNIATASYDHTTGITTLTATGYTPTTGDSAVLSGLNFICPTHGVYTITGSVPIDASGNVVAVDSPSLAGYRLNFYNTVNGGLRSPIAASQAIDFRLRSQISCALHTMEYVGSGTNYNALPWNGGVPIAANQRVELNNGRVFGATINEKGDFEIGDGTFSIDGTTGSATINTSEFNISGLNFVGPFSRNGGFSTVGVQLREVSDNTSLIASTGASDGNTVPTQNAVKDYVDSTTVQSVDLSAPTGFTSTGGPITGSGTLALGYDTGYQGYLTAESTKLSGIEAGAQVNVNADWNATTGDAFIENKPTIPAAYTDSDVDTHLNTSTANNNEVLSWTGSDYDWVAQSGGGGGGLTNFTESQSTYSSSVSSIFDASGTDTNINAVLSPKGTGAFIGQEPDGTTAGGNARAAYAVDLQFSRSDATQVTSGYASALIGGTNNKATSSRSVILGGFGNTNTSFNSAILGGQSNTISNSQSISGGYQNTLSGYNNFAFGYQNTTSNQYSIALGRESTSDADYSMALGLKANTHGIRGLHAIAPFATNSSTYKNPQFYKVILTAVTPEGSGDSNDRFLTTDGGSLAGNPGATDSRYNSIYLGRTDGTDARQIYIEGIIKASQVGGGLNHINHAVWEVSGFLGNPGPNGDTMTNRNVTKKFGSSLYDDPDLSEDYGSSGSGNSQEWWWRLKVMSSSSHSVLWTAYLTCYVTDET